MDKGLKPLVSRIFSNEVVQFKCVLAYELLQRGIKVERQVPQLWLGMLINFNVPVLKQGIKRLVNN